MCESVWIGPFGLYAEHNPAAPKKLDNLYEPVLLGFVRHAVFSG
jgi:hypothetical protein